MIVLKALVLLVFLDTNNPGLCICDDKDGSHDYDPFKGDSMRGMLNVVVNFELHVSNF